MAQEQRQRQDPNDPKVRDHWGREVEPNVDALPEDAPARTGNTTPPSGQGGATPHDGVSYQDQFSPNPEPSESAREHGERLDAEAKGEKVEKRAADKREPAKK
jgi:hypothetical protein